MVEPVKKEEHITLPGHDKNVLMPVITKAGELGEERAVLIDGKSWVITKENCRKIADIFFEASRQ